MPAPIMTALAWLGTPFINHLPFLFLSDCFGSHEPHAFGDQFRNILVLNTGVPGCQPIFHHGHAERTSRSHDARLFCARCTSDGLLYLVHASLVHPFASFFFDPHQSSTGSTAHTVFTALFHLYNLQPRNFPEHLSWSVEHTVVTAQITGVVISDNSLDSG